MKKFMVATAMSVGLMGAAASTAQAGCLTGAVVGGIAGHFAGRHGLLGAAAGCAIGHSRKVQNRRAQQQQIQGGQYTR